MKERGVPVHGVGMQAHFTAAGTRQRRPPTPHSVRRNVRRFGDLGLTVNISEMDVRITDVSKETSPSYHTARWLCCALVWLRPMRVEGLVDLW